MTTAQTTDFIKVTAISELLKDARGYEYRRITVQGSPALLPAFDPETGESFMATLPGRTGSVNAYPDPAQGPNSFLFATKVGARFAGQVVTRNVCDYTTSKGNTANTYSCPVFGDTTAEDFEDTITAEFRRNKRPLLTDKDYDPTPRASAVKPEPTAQPVIAQPAAQPVTAQPVAAPVAAETAQPAAQPAVTPAAAFPAAPAAPDIDETEEW